MELGVLNDKFQLARPVEGHSSLIWTERFSSCGDFQRVSNDIGGTLAMLPVVDENGDPVTTVVSLRDSDVPMVVETHKITKPLKGQPSITTYGRSFETVLDRRTTIKDALGAGKVIKPWAPNPAVHTAVDAAYEVVNQVVTLAVQNGRPNDVIPEITMRLPVRPAGYQTPTITRAINVEPGELYDWVLQQVLSENYSLRSVRPKDLTTTTISIEIYTGTDKTREVVFDARFDQFDSTEYLLSQAAWKNVDQVAGAQDSLEVTDGTTRSGLQRRVAYNDASQIATGPPSTALTSIMQNLGTVDLAKQLQTALFAGEVSRQKGSKYGKDYFLGDVVKLSGDYGLSQFVRISEFIRSEDNNGEKAYPTFASL